MFVMLLQINSLYALAKLLHSEATEEFYLLVLELNIDACTIAREM